MTDMGKDSAIFFEREQWVRIEGEYKKHIEEVTVANAKLLGKLQRAQGHIERLVKDVKQRDAMIIAMNGQIAVMKSGLASDQ